MDTLPISTKDQFHISIEAPRFRISIAKLLFFGFSILPIGLIYMIIKTMIVDFEGSTWTQCLVLNILPSVSSIAKNNEFLWKVLTLEVLPFRLMIMCLYCRYYWSVFSGAVHPLGWLALPLFIHETLSTLVMARWTHIAGNSLIHVATVLSIWISSAGYMGLTCYCFRKYNRHVREPHEKVSYMLKVRLVQVFFGGNLVMWGLYFMHNCFCLPLAYTGFALCEYTVSLCLMGYLWTSYFDFYQVYLCYDSKAGYYLQNT